MPHLNINGKNFHYIFHNNNHSETILLGHSYLFDHKMWDPQISVLSKNYNIVIPDLWGHGDSDNKDLSNYTLEDLAEDHAQIMHSLGIKQYHIIGLSVGGMWAPRVALLYQERVKSLVLMGTDLYEEETQARGQYFQLLEQVLKDKTFTDEMANTITSFFHSPKASKEIKDYIKSSILSLKDENIETIVQLGKIIFSRPSILEKLDQINIPTLIIVGKDDVPRPPFESKRIHKYINNSKYFEIAYAGHLSNIEQPEEINKLIINFLDEVTKSSD